MSTSKQRRTSVSYNHAHTSPTSTTANQSRSTESGRPVDHRTSSSITQEDRQELGRVTSRHRSKQLVQAEEGEGGETATATATPTGRISRQGKQVTQLEDGRNYRKKQAWYIRWVKTWGKGMWHDIHNRAPYYLSDWTDAWNYRVVPATWVRPHPSLTSLCLPSATPIDLHVPPPQILLQLLFSTSSFER